MNYLTIRMIHETAVALSVIGFFIRGLGRLRGAGAGWLLGRQPNRGRWEAHDHRDFRIPIVNSSGSH